MQPARCSCRGNEALNTGSHADTRPRPWPSAVPATTALKIITEGKSPLRRCRDAIRRSPPFHYQGLTSLEDHRAHTTPSPVLLWLLSPPGRRAGKSSVGEGPPEHKGSARCSRPARAYWPTGTKPPVGARSLGILHRRPQCAWHWSAALTLEPSPGPATCATAPVEVSRRV